MNKPSTLLTRERIASYKESIVEARRKIDLDLFQPEDESQLRRMCAYYEEQIKASEAYYASLVNEENQ